MPARALAAMLVAAAVGQTSPPAPAARLVVRYSVSSEDDTANNGRLTLALKSGQPSRARIWEVACHLATATDASGPPPDAEQVWGLSAELTSGRDNRTAVRLETAHVAPNGMLHDETHTLTLDDPRPLALSELSARTDCRYDRIHLTVSAETVR